MDNIKHNEDIFRINYESGKKFIGSGDIGNAEQCFKRALEAEINLIKSTYGSEQSRHRGRADQLIAWIRKIDEIIAQQQSANAVGRSDGGKSGQGDSGKNEKLENLTKQDNVIPPSEKTLEEARAELDALEGLDEVKARVNELIDIVNNRNDRIRFNLPVPPMSYHMVFSGNPGTGKTTVARLMGEIFHALGIVSKGQLVEVFGRDLVAGYVGQTSAHTMEIIQRAVGGVLFIDEAYTLNQGGKDFGQEAVATLMKFMEDNRDDLVVIVAGYGELMENFIAMNPGLNSRFMHKLNFADYDGTSLYNIFRMMCKNFEYVLTDDADAAIKEYLAKYYEQRNENFGNARDVRNIYEQTITNQSKRLKNVPEKTREILQEITIEDLPGNIQKYKEGE